MLLYCKIGINIEVCIFNISWPSICLPLHPQELQFGHANGANLHFNPRTFITVIKKNVALLLLQTLRQESLTIGERNSKQETVRHLVRVLIFFILSNPFDHRSLFCLISRFFVLPITFEPLILVHSSVDKNKEKEN